MDKKKTRIVLRHPKSMQTEINSMVSKKEIKKSFMDKKDFINRLWIIEMQNFTIKSIVLENSIIKSFMERERKWRYDSIPINMTKHK